MKNNLVLLFLLALAPCAYAQQNIPIVISDCTISSLPGIVVPTSTPSWIMQTFTVHNAGFAQELHLYIGHFASNQVGNATVAISDSDGAVLETHAIDLNPTGTSFIVSDYNVWTHVPLSSWLNAGVYAITITNVSELGLLMFGSCNINPIYTDGMAESDSGNIAFTTDIAFAIDMSCDCIGDFNGDGFRSIADLLMLNGAIGSMASEFDITYDGAVTLQDLLLFIDLYGNPCP